MPFKKYEVYRHQDKRYLEVQQSVQLVLNDGQSFNQLLRVHGAHDSVNTARHRQTNNQSSPVSPLILNSKNQLLNRLLKTT